MLHELREERGIPLLALHAQRQPPLHDAIAFDVSEYRVCAQLEDSSIYCWET
ncbi:MAG: hypothetical protein RBU37_23470 [Myxococcota bacterium]|jgi:hypothetical protein|nr:hypothetical protein [Myxococcota bacterium]